MSYLPQNLIGTLRRLATNTYTVTRTAPGTYGEGLAGGLPYSQTGDGRFVPGTTSTFTIKASIQPLTGQELLRLPEGLRTQQLIRVYTDTPLQTAQAPNGVSADLIQYGTGSFEVQLVDNWSESGKFFKVIAAKVGQ